jgi:SAM-dependent methyltransferase
MSWNEGLPPRYREPWREPFDRASREVLSNGVAVLDIGGGRNPSIALTDRPPGTVYVGLDLDADELNAAGPGVYTEAVAADASTFVPRLEGRFDLAVSWQVLEHVPDLAAAVENVRRYLVPGGRFVAFFSGGRAAYALINRALPERLAAPIVTRVMRRGDSNPVFPAYYDECTYDGVNRAFSRWSMVQVEPKYRAASYFRHLRLVLRAYVAYENLAAARWPNLATHYLVVATR